LCPLIDASICEAEADTQSNIFGSSAWKKQYLIFNLREWRMQVNTDFIFPICEHTGLWLEVNQNLSSEEGKYTWLSVQYVIHEKEKESA